MAHTRQRNVYEAIADPTRREIIDLLAERPEYPLHALTSHFPMGRTAVSKHLSVLREAELVIGRKVGRETRYRLNPTPLKQVQDWLSHYENFWNERAAALNRLLEEGEKLQQGISLDFHFKSPIHRVWEALTDSKKLAEWIYPNDFNGAVGHKFQFRAEPSQWWDGIIDCEVLEISEPHHLKYTWASGGENTTVIWTLEQADDGSTRVHLEQLGFESEQSFKGASHGWQRMCGQLENALGENSAQQE